MGYTPTIARIGMTLDVEKMKRRRTLLGLNLCELSRTIGCHRSTLGHVENGRRQPNVTLLGQIAEALDVPSEWLLTTTSVDDWNAAQPPRRKYQRRTRPVESAA